MTQRSLTLTEAAKAGLVVPFPNELAVDNHPGTAGGPVAYICAVPMQLADEAGNVRDLGSGDVLSRSEVAAARTSLHGLIARHSIFAVPATTGVVGLCAALLSRTEDATA